MAVLLTVEPVACPQCGAGDRRPVHARDAAAVPAHGAAAGQVLTWLGWTGVVLLAVLVAVLTALLAGMMLLLSPWLAAAVPVAVLVLVQRVVSFVRREA